MRLYTAKDIKRPVALIPVSYTLEGRNRVVWEVKRLVFYERVAARADSRAIAAHVGIEKNCH